LVWALPSFFILVVVLFGFADRSASSQTQRAVISLDPRTTYQTMLGWEATAQAGEVDSPGFPAYQDFLFDQAVNDLGINRLRVEVREARSGSGFDLDRFDRKMRLVALPMKQRLEARGERLFLNICTVEAFRNNPTGYANAVLGLYRHLQATYGFLPDRWEVALEPESFNWGPPASMVNTMVATGDLLKANGFPVAFTAPSNPSIDSAIRYFDEIARNPTALGYLSEFAYHSYGGGTDANRRAVAERALRHGKTTAMLEHIGADYAELHRDLKIGMVSAWQQYTLAYPATDGDNGAQFYFVDQAQSTPERILRLGRTATYLRQYFKHVRLGAVRIGATTADPSFDPVAFVNAGGTQVVVVSARAGGPVTIQGLPGGTYGVSYTTAARSGVELGEVALRAGDILSTAIPEAGVLTVYGKTPGQAPPAPPAPASEPLPASQNYCPDGQAPRFVAGFLALRDAIGEGMGQPLECEHANPENGDALQKTTTGLAFYRKSTNTPTFTNGWDHWALTPDGLVYWTGESIDPPGR
jgi:O-glycosyl hydrolase